MKEKERVTCGCCGEPRWRYRGEYLRGLRLKMGLTLQGMADRAGVSPGYIHDVENGRRTCTERLASKYGAGDLK